MLSTIGKQFLQLFFTAHLRKVSVSNANQWHSLWSGKLNNGVVGSVDKGTRSMPIQADIPFFPLFNCQAVEIGKYAKMIKHCWLFLLSNLIQYIIDRFSYNIFNRRNPLVNLIWFGHLHPAEQNQSTQNYFTWAPCQEEHVYIILRAFL